MIHSGLLHRSVRICRGSRRTFLCACLVIAGSLPSIAHGGEITIYRDIFGTPHIEASNAVDACYGMGYAQATDRLDEVLKQYRRATGTLSEVFGAAGGNLESDYRQRLWQHAAIARQKYDQVAPEVRSMIEAFQGGIRAFMAEHPEKVPAWAPELEPWMCIALCRYIIWGWPEGDAAGDLERVGIKPGPIEYHGSNEWLVAGSRTKDKAPIALIDPHLSWYGQFRFYEARIYGGELAFSGMAIEGIPFPALGHNRYCSIAMTTGGPDCADCYEEEINPANPRQYRYDGQWKDMTIRTEIIRVREQDTVAEKKFDIAETIHGPVVARRGKKAYTFKIPYAEEVGLAEQIWRMCTAKNLAEMKQALSMLQLMEQNVMIGTVDGDIYYVRNGRVPVRAPGFDYKKPVPGNTSKSEWRGIHPFADLLQVENPPQGYMQNCNVSPQFMTRGTLIDPEKWKNRPDLFNGYFGPDRHDDHPLHQRAAMCLELLEKATNMSVEDALTIADSPDVYGAAQWRALLDKAWSSSDNRLKSDANAARFFEVVRKWNGRCDADGVGAVAYHYWIKQFPPVAKDRESAGTPPAGIEGKPLLSALKRAADKMKSDFGHFEVRYGDVYRVGRKGTGRDWPVSGGSLEGLRTPRAISFDPVDKKNRTRYLGVGGQTSTQVVLLTNPPRSWTVLPLGESDDPKSAHYDDQAEMLFSKSRFKSSYFLDKPELLKHQGAPPKTIVRH